jgi:hypothetical protein
VSAATTTMPPRRAVARVGRLFIHEVNVAIVGVIALAAVACGVHYVSTLGELRRARQDLCAARLELMASRHPYLKETRDVADKCGALAILTGGPANARGRRASLKM